jgi:hypothetical protein
MIARLIILALALTATAAMSQTVLLPGFPAGLFGYRGALNGIPGGSSGSACLLVPGIILPCQDPLTNTPTLIGGF